jgi:hypothetical protein
MAIAATYCRGQLGLTAPLVQVEVNLGAGLPMFSNVQALLHYNRFMLGPGQGRPSWTASR